MTGQGDAAVRTPDWTGAVCRETDPEMFFHRTGEQSGTWIARSAYAKELCRTCPLMVDCFEYAYETGQEHGVWGGHRAEEIQAIKRRHKRAEKASS